MKIVKENCLHNGVEYKEGQEVCDDCGLPEHLLKDLKEKKEDSHGKTDRKSR